MNTGAQGVRPAPAGTIPGELRPFSERPDSAMSRLKARLREGKSGTPKPAQTTDKPSGTPSEPAAAAPPVEEPAPAAEEDDLDGGVGVPPKVEEKKVDDKKPAEAPKVEDDKTKKEKVNPWKLIDEHKGRAAKLEQELAEARKLVPNAEQRKAEMAEVENLKKRNQELEEHIKFVDYQASDEFKNNHQKPYEDQWRASMRDLKGILVSTDEGDRAIAPADLIDLVNMTAVEADVAAEERFGRFAPHVMRERDKIREKWDAQQAALAEAKKNGVSKFDQQNKANQETFQKITSEVRDIYTKAIDSSKSNPAVAEFINERDGDAKHNELLTKGHAFVDEAFRQNPMDPSLSPEQRQQIVKKHVALRQRAVIATVLRYHLNNERAAHAETKKRLAAFEGTVPNRGESTPAAAAAPVGGSAMDRMKARLRARAK